MFVKLKNKFKQIMFFGDVKAGFRLIAMVAFAESSFFPIPPDLLIIWFVARFKDSWLKSVLISTVFSLAGGLFGYIIGFFFFDIIGKPLISFYGLENEIGRVGLFFSSYGFWSLFIAAFTPIPYKVFTIAGGFFGMNIFIFTIASFLGRGARFIVVAYLTKILGKKFEKEILKHFNLITLFVGILMFGILIYIFFI